VRHETVVEIDRPQIDEMLRAYLAAKFGVRVTPMHDVRLTVHKDKFVVRVIDPPPAPGAKQ
jgi:hypothetical protein